MRYIHKKGVISKQGKSPWLSKVLLLVAVVGLVGGAYLMVLVLTPNIPVLFPVEPIQAKKLPSPTGDKIYIPKIGVSVSIEPGNASVLERGAWHRYPDRGDPINGGNFIVSAHRFSLGITPGQTRVKSPFYHIDKLAVGDQILVDYKGKRYGYEVEQEKKVKPNQVEIEEKSQEAKLTLYTCTLKGENDGREVFIAKPLGEVDKDGKVWR